MMLVDINKKPNTAWILGFRGITVHCDIDPLSFKNIFKYMIIRIDLTIKITPKVTPF